MSGFRGKAGLHTKELLIPVPRCHSRMHMSRAESNAPFRTIGASQLPMGLPCSSQQSPISPRHRPGFPWHPRASISVCPEVILSIMKLLATKGETHSLHSMQNAPMIIKLTFDFFLSPRSRWSEPAFLFWPASMVIYM